MHRRTADYICSCNSGHTLCKTCSKDRNSDLVYMSLQMVYSRRLVVCVADSTQQIFLTAQGQGEEPQLEFCPSVLELGPCLPASNEVEAEITVKNPCSFPIEFYSLELDTRYLEEEKVVLFFSRKYNWLSHFRPIVVYLGSVAINENTVNYNNPDF